MESPESGAANDNEETWVTCPTCKGSCEDPENPGHDCDTCMGNGGWNGE